MRRIPLTKGFEATVDDGDYDYLMQVGHWHVATCDGKYYARHYYRDQFGVPRHVSMHTLLTGWPRVDHINGDGLDNRRANLRAATSSQNSANSRLATTNTSGYKGVTYFRRTGRWRAYLGGHRQRHLGYFDTPEEAARAYDAAALARWGTFARLNFPPQEKAS